MAASPSGEGRGDPQPAGQEQHLPFGRTPDRPECGGEREDGQGAARATPGFIQPEAAQDAGAVSRHPTRPDGDGLAWTAPTAAAASGNPRPAPLPAGDGCRLQPPVTAAEWEAYHLIREHVFLESGEAGFRRSDEDEDRLPDHFPLVLWTDDEPVGTIRVDVLEGARAALRLVAIHPSRQARGHGARMLHLAETFARERGCRTAVVYSTLEAAGFYASGGYIEDSWDDCCIGGIVQMSKRL